MLVKAGAIGPCHKTLSTISVLQSIQRFSSKYPTILSFFACFLSFVLFLFGGYTRSSLQHAVFPELQHTGASLVAACGSRACGLSGCGGVLDASPWSLPLSSSGALPSCVSNHMHLQRIFNDLENFSKHNAEFKNRHMYDPNFTKIIISVYFLKIKILQKPQCLCMGVLFTLNVS